MSASSSDRTGGVTGDCGRCYRRKRVDLDVAVALVDLLDHGLLVNRHLDRLTDVLNREIILAHLMSNPRQQVQNIGMAWICLQNLPVNRLGLLQIA